MAVSTTAKLAVVPTVYAVGAVCLIGEAAAHVQQFIALFSGVRWIGPLFIANAFAAALVIAGLAYPRTRTPAALAGVAMSAVALGSLAISYGEGLFGWQEVGFRAPIAVAVASEVGAVILLSTGLALTSLQRQRDAAVSPRS
jgi:hypothetical protein